MKPSDLHVIAVISNPYRYNSRYRLYNEFEKRMLDAGVRLWTCELQTGERPFAVTGPDNVQQLQLRSRSITWHKENMQNLMLARLPADAKYVAFVDADVAFIRHDWVMETLHQLQIHPVIQMWREADDLGPNGETIQTHSSFAYRWFNQLPIQQTATSMYNQFGHPGFAWAWRIDALSQMGTMTAGPILDQGILGAGDHHMCMGIVGQVEKTIPGNINAAYREMCVGWQEAAKVLNQDIGYLDTKLVHYWHGKKRNRFYKERWSIIIENDYTPWLDLRRDWQGLYTLTDRNPKLRDDIRRYFLSRNEDSTDL